MEERKKKVWARNIKKILNKITHCVNLRILKEVLKFKTKVTDQDYNKKMVKKYVVAKVIRAIKFAE
jgi:hypothetical protein